jgi:2-polyprenyl-3-methyl-5-hydroxy-6-metoxy-1,4-benzoquinol methylase
MCVARAAACESIFVSTVEASFVAGDWPAQGLERVERCPACGGTSRSLLYADLTDRSYRSAPGRWSLHRCGDCTCAYLDPRPDEATSALAYRTYYDDAAPPPEPDSRRGWRRVRRALRNGYLSSRYGYRLSPASAIGRLAVPLLPRYRELADEHVRHLRLPEGRPRLLDVGCGEGEFLAEMQSLGWSAEGLDPSAEAVTTAQARGVPARQATLSEAQLEPKSFDAITFRLVFEHLRGPVSALAECRRALQVGGVLWIATPSLDSEAHLIFGRNWIHLEPPRHAVVYTASALKRLLEATGFEIVAVRPSRQARWSFRLSAALAQGRSPFESAPPLSRRLALRAALADLRALRRPEQADVVVVIARAG